jgi:hypothetical protein
MKGGEMKTDEFTPLTSLWGKVTNVREAPRRKGCIELALAGQKIVLQRTTDDGLGRLGLLRLSKKNEKVFLVLFENKASKKHTIVAGWRNPPDLLVRQLQPLVLADDDSLYETIARSYPAPTWKDFDLDIDPLDM